MRRVTARASSTVAVPNTQRIWSAQLDTEATVPVRRARPSEMAP